MKTKFAIIISLLCCVSLYAHGQFYTISDRARHKSYNRRLIQQKENENESKCSNTHESTYTKTDSIVSNKLEEILRNYISVSYPLKQVHITSPFGMRFHPIDKVKKFHNGIDLKAKSEEVYAMLDGIIQNVGYDNASGNFITIEHDDNIIVSYCHLTKPLLCVGDKVKAGDPIAISGNTGKSTDFHLHLVIRRNNKYLNPITFLHDIEEVRNKSIREYLELKNQETTFPIS